MTNKYFSGTVTDKGVAEEVDADLKAVTESTPKAVEDKMEELRVADAMTEISISSNAATNTSTRQCRGHLQKMRQRKTVWRPFSTT
mgnify:CR=1 FL=1